MAEQCGPLFFVMSTNRKVINYLREAGIFIAIAFVMTWTGLSCSSCAFNSPDFWLSVSLTSVIWFLLWKGNSWLADFLTDKISWVKYPITRFLVGLVATVVYTLAVLYLVLALYNLSFEVRMTRTSTIFSIVITIMISLFMHGRAFFINWRQVAINAEKLARENMAARYESLKNQVNPHFLFNSFNALTNLVYEDQDKAVKFIKQLSEVYRYVLDTRDKEVVPLEQEVKFLQSYLYLQKIRFGDKLDIHFALADVNSQVAPLALQMLIENAIKHNVVSEDDPLHVYLFAADGFIVVENNLQKKTRLGEPSVGVGLENICRRYEYLSQTKAVVQQTADKFIVKLPLLSGI